MQNKTILLVNDITLASDNLSRFIWRLHWQFYSTFSLTPILLTHKTHTIHNQCNHVKNKCDHIKSKADQHIKSISHLFSNDFLRILLNHAPTSTQFHLPLPSSTQLHPPPLSSFQPHQYSNQSIAHYWAISPNLGRKIQSYPFWLNIGTNVILEVLIPSPDLDFWISDPKIHFWANLGQKSHSCPFCLKICTHGISRMLILIPTLVFWISEFSKFLFRQIWAKIAKLSIAAENWQTEYNEDADSYFEISFLKF